MKRSHARNERLVGLFLLGLVLFEYPMLALFNAPRLVLGVPLLYLYLFLAWAAVIAISAIVLHRTEDG